MSALDEIRGRVEAATPGPWGAFPGYGAESKPIMAILQSPFSPNSDYVADTETTRQGIADAEFIANAPTDVARLLNAVQAVEGRLSQWEERFTAHSAEDTAMRAAIYLIRKDITSALEAKS